MGIADARVDMMPQSAAPATKLIARAFTGHLPIVGARPVQARQPRTGVDGSDFLDWPKAQIDHFPLPHALENLLHGKLRVTCIARQPVSRADEKSPERAGLRCDSEE